MTTATILKEQTEVEHIAHYLDELEAREPNEETIAAMREAENLDNLTTCVDLQDMLKQCGIKR